MAPGVLLAKRPRNPDRPVLSETLAGHIGDVLRAAESLLNCSAEASLDALGLHGDHVTRLRKAVLSAAVLHDIGKANSEFQRMIVCDLYVPQSLRHEWLSAAAVLRSPELSDWLFGGDVSVKDIALGAALGHHLKADDASTLSPRDGSQGTSLDVYLGHADIRATLEQAASALGLGAPPALHDFTVDLVFGALEEVKGWLFEAQCRLGVSPEEVRYLIALVKATLVAADVAGSAVPRQGLDPAGWVMHVLARTCDSVTLGRVVRERLGGAQPRPFQLAVGAAGPVAFVRAGCGTGKTAAAYLWAAKHAPGRKLFICYPTTGTATEGFRDYIVPTDLGAEAALVHSRSEYDLEALLPADEEPIDQMSRLEALRAWDAPVIVCTVDTVLGLLQNARRPLFSFPSIANGAFVFDEIHQYDGRLFAELLRFLGVFRGVPVLLMTASLPKERLEALQQVAPGIEVLDGPAEIETLPRYLLSPPCDDEPWDKVQKVLDDGGKVLWVCNTVDRCAAIAQGAETRGITVLPYHSRYRYCDRLQRHVDVISAFQAPGPALAVTTQVCEVSLDLSASLLVSDLAPVPALIQRLGRLNRRATPEVPGDPMPAVFLATPRPEPYEPQDLTAARAWLDALGTRPVSQADLARVFEAVCRPQAIDSVTCAWLDGGVLTGQAPARDADTTIPVVRYEDREHCTENGRPSMRRVTGYSIPMPLRPVVKELPSWPRVGIAYVAPEGHIDYSERWGAKWLKP